MITDKPYCHACMRQFAPGDRMAAADDHAYHQACLRQVAEIGMDAFRVRHPTPLEQQQERLIADMEAKCSRLTAEVESLRAQLGAVGKKHSAERDRARRLEKRVQVLEQQREDVIGRAEASIAPRPPAPPPASPPAAPERPVDGPVDSPAMRFGMIELD